MTPIHAEVITVGLNLPITAWMPLVVVNIHEPPRPALMPVSCTLRPSRTTVMRWVTVFTLLTLAVPTWNDTVVSCVP